MPRVQLDAREVRDPRQRVDVVDDREDGGVTVRELLHVEGPAPKVGENDVRDARVVRDQVELRQAPLREEDLVRIRDVHAQEYRGAVLERHPIADVTLEPLDDYI